MITPLDYPLRKLFWLVLILIPFSSTKAFLPLGELENDIAAQLAIFSSLLFFFTLAFKNRHSLILNKNYLLLLLLICVFFIGYFLNLNSIAVNTLKGKKGNIRFITQTGIYITYAIFILHYFYNYIKTYNTDFFLKRCSSVISIVFYITCFYAFIEIAYGIYNFQPFGKIYALLNQVFLKEKSQSWNLGRISGITQEPPFLAMYLIFVNPFVTLRLINSRSILRFIPIILLAICAIYSGSRTAFIVLSFQTGVLLFFSYRKKLFRIRVIELITLVCLLITFVFIVYNKQVIQKTKHSLESVYNKTDNNKHSVSNITRWGTQKAALKVWQKHAFWGVGIGQQGFYLIKEYNSGDVEKSWELKYYKDPHKELWPPGYSMVTRLLSETGIIGFLIFTIFNVIVICKLISIFLKSSDLDSLSVLVVITGLSGFLVNYLQFDSFRLIGYWFFIAWSFVIFKRSEYQ